MRYIRAILSGLIVAFGLLGLALLHAQTVTPAQPTTPCASGQDWKLCTTCKPQKWICPAMPACTRRCSFDDNRPNSQPTGGMCFMSDKVRWWGEHPTIKNDIATGELFPPGIFDFTGARLDTQTVNGKQCYYIMPHSWKNDLIESAPAPAPAPQPLAVPVVTNLSTELLPLKP